MKDEAMIMRNKVLSIALVVCFTMGMSGCTNPDPVLVEQNANRSLVESYAQAYNAHDLDVMAALMHDDIEWINIENSEQTIITADKAALTQELSSYFAGEPKSNSTLSDWSVNGNYVSTKETVTFTRKDGTTESQASLSVYELDNGLIRRVWYFPAQ